LNSYILNLVTIGCVLHYNIAAPLFHLLIIICKSVQSRKTGKVAKSGKTG